MANTTLQQRLPDALIIGEMKCGTTALMTFLNLHPNLILPQKEINFFSYEYRAGFDWYLSQMPLARNDQLVMEKGMYFMGKFRSVEHIFSYKPEIKMLLILRDPTDRIISEFTMKKRNHPEKFGNKTLEQILSYGKSGILKKNDEFIRRSKYCTSMRRWLRYFTLAQIHIIDGEEFQENPVKELVEIEKFLGVNSYFKEDMFIMNEEKGFYCFQDACLPPTKGRKSHEFISEEFKQRLVDYFRPYNEAFFELVGRRFNWK